MILQRTLAEKGNASPVLTQGLGNFNDEAQLPILRADLLIPDLTEKGAKNLE